ncbi:unnamed protein product [marine sediment metagenome]|uniref:Uncharacterized protein n=1 Tax=marine sediment metagenome TaxID=412755 RepID=X1BM24_9ZZZZ
MFENMTTPSPIITMIVFLVPYTAILVHARRERKRRNVFLVGIVDKGVVTWMDEPKTTASK